MIPKRSKRPKMGVRQPDKIVCPGHCKWTRGHECAVAGKIGTAPLGSPFKHECQGRMEAHHVESRGAWGGDEQVVPLCTLAHANIHGGCTFPVDLAKLAAELWQASPHRRTWEAKQS